jgi:hypothetical protein
MLGIRLENGLQTLAGTSRSKSYYGAGIPQCLEERDDYLKGLAGWERREPSIFLDELEHQLRRDP